MSSFPLREVKTIAACVGLFLSVQADAAFVVPRDFVVQKAASEPDVRFPMFAVFDDRGRLFVTESSGGDLYKEISQQSRLCKVRVLEDANVDGVFERSTLFAERVNFPMGLAWRSGRLYLADPPDLVTLVDTNNDGRADVRTVLLTGFGHKDNGSLHGLTFGPDGWLYMTCGEPDGYKIQRPDGSLLEGHNGALLRCRPDGSNIEVLSRGFVNLVEVVFTPAGEIIGTDNWFRLPSGGVRDALVHLVPGGLYPLHLKDIGTQHPVLSEPLPAISMFPAVALSGLVRYGGLSFPREMRGNLFAAEHNSRKVSRHVLHRNGSTFRAEAHDFLSTDDPDFHPSDVLTASDGSLIVLDTGSWYIHHCPTGRIRKSPATGGIYRIRYIEDQPALSPQDQEQHQVWSMAEDLTQGGSLKLRGFLTNQNATIASAAARVLALRRDRVPARGLASLLFSSDAEVSLASAEALAHCGTIDVLPEIWEAFGDGSDPFFEHTLTYAAHHLAGAHELKRALRHHNPRVQAAALRLLEQPPRTREALASGDVRRLLISSNVSLRGVALQVLLKRPEWVADARKLLRDLSQSRQLPEPDAFTDLALAFKSDPHVQATIASAIIRGPTIVRVAALNVCARSGFSSLPAPWAPAIAQALADSTLATHALKVIAALNLKGFDDVLTRLADDSNEPAVLRLQALAVLVARSPKLSRQRFDFLVEQLCREPLAALAAADIVRRAAVDDGQLNTILQTLPPQSPVVPGPLLSGLRECASTVSASNLLNTVATLKAEIADGDWDTLESRIPAELRPRARELRQFSRSRRVAHHAKLAEFATLLDGGDPNRGRALFFDTRTSCAACHAVGADGGKVGPDLTRIGAIRSGRDILESVLLPSSTFAQTYEPYRVITADGRELMGTLARQDAESILLRDATGAEVHLPRSSVRELHRQEISIMPEGLESGLSKGEFRDLLAFLQSLK